MLSRNLYRVKKSPLANKRRKFIMFAVIAACLLLVAFGFYKLTHMAPPVSQKAAATVQTGDQPVPTQLVVYVNADGGLSLRESKDATSKRLVLIPNGTKLTVSQELEGWYKVNFDNKDGWISKQYTTTTAPAADPTAGWQTFSGSGYKVKYEVGWNVQDYGKNDATGMASVVAFSNQTLPTAIPTGSDFIAPVVIDISTKSSADTNKVYAAMSGVVVEPLTVAGATAQKYTYTAASSNTQVTTVVLAGPAGTFVFSEAGGYSDDLLKMLNTFTIG